MNAHSNETPLTSFHTLMDVFGRDGRRPNVELAERFSELVEKLPQGSPEQDLATDAMVWAETDIDFPVLASRTEILERYRLMQSAR